MPLVADGRGRTVARIHDRLIGQPHQFCAQGIHDLVHGTAPQIRAADAAGKKRVSGKKLRRRNSDFSGVMRKIERDAAGGVAGCVNDLRLERPPVQNVAFLQQLIDVGKFGREDSQKSGLHFHGLIKRQIVAMHEHGGARILMELAQTADVINMSVSADDRFHIELVAADKVQNARHLVARINNQGFASDGVPNDGAVALQQAHRNGDVDQSLRGGIKSGQSFAHALKYSIGNERICGRRCMPRGAV